MTPTERKLALENAQEEHGSSVALLTELRNKKAVIQAEMKALDKDIKTLEKTIVKIEKERSRLGEENGTGN